MTTLERTNNHAASLISSGRCLEAYVELHRAMGDFARQITLDESFGPLNQDNNGLFVAPLSPLCPASESCAFLSPLLFTGSDVEDHSTENLSCAFATALFNMALAIQSFSTRDGLPLAERRGDLLKCQNLYQHAFDVIETQDLPLLRLALCNNLLDLAFEQADLGQVAYWASRFNESMEVDVFNVPSHVLVHFLKVQLYFIPSLCSARAA